MIICGISTCDCECNNTCKIDEYLHIKGCSCEKHLIGKLVLACEDNILSTTETSIDEKSVTHKKIIVLFTRFHC